jgi:hypothetical protein
LIHIRAFIGRDAKPMDWGVPGRFPAAILQRQKFRNFAVIVGLRWELTELSRISLRQVRIDRGLKYADETGVRCTQFGIRHGREYVVNHRREIGSRLSRR